MFRFGKVTWSSSGGFAPYQDAPDAVSGGGSTHPVDGGDGVPPSDVDIDTAVAERPPAVQTTDDDEDDDDPDLSTDAEVTPERFKRVTAKLAKLNRRDKSFRVERARLKELRDQGVTLDDLIHGTRQHRILAAQLAENPTLRKLVNGDEAAEARREDPPARATEDDPDFDEKALPFDPDENDTHRFFADLAKRNHALVREAKQLAKRLEQIEGKETGRELTEKQRVEKEERTTWKGAIDAAAATLDDDMTRTLFKDAMTAAFHDRTRHGRTPQQIIAHYLKGKVAPGQAKVANAAAAKVPAAPVRTAATQQRIAESNKTLPRTVAPSGTPASARTGKESLNDVRRRVTGTNAKW